MNLIVISLLAVASMSLLPSRVDGGGAPSTNAKTAAAAVPLGEIWQEDDREVLIRNERGAKNKDAQTGSASGKKGKNRKNKPKDPNANHGLHKHSKQTHDQVTSPSEQNRSCRYSKSQWSECDAKSNQRTRTLTLKRGEAGCVQTRTIQKKCKKACRYEKGAWTECVGGKMSRVDKLRSSNSGDATGATAICEPTRNVQKNCNAAKKGEKKERQNKEKGGRKGRV